VAGLGIAGVAFAARAGLLSLHAWTQAPRAMLRGGFLPEMTRREAAQILNIRETAPERAVKEAHRRIMIANHPDSGGSSYIATKVNEAKDMLLGKRKAGPGL
jgi:DnaJ homolog subfamily C member 19